MYIQYKLKKTRCYYQEDLYYTFTF